MLGTVHKIHFMLAVNRMLTQARDSSGSSFALLVFSARTRLNVCKWPFETVKFFYRFCEYCLPENKMYSGWSSVRFKRKHVRCLLWKWNSIYVIYFLEKLNSRKYSLRILFHAFKSIFKIFYSRWVYILLFSDSHGIF